MSQKAARMPLATKVLFELFCVHSACAQETSLNIVQIEGITSGGGSSTKGFLNFMYVL